MLSVLVLSGFLICNVYDIDCKKKSLARNGIRFGDKQSLLLTYRGIHLQDRYQICFYPLLHHTDRAEVELEIVDYIGVENDLPVYACCSPGKKWVNLHFGGSFIDQMTVSDSLEGTSLEECILDAVSVMKRSNLLSNRVCMKWQRKT